MKKRKKHIPAGKTRRVFRYYRYTECDAFCQYLHEMSLKGWHFIRWHMGLVFLKGDPADITYCIEVFPKGSEMDLKPENQAEEYADYCKAAGWELIDGQKKFCIFRQKDSDAPPIVTEEERFFNVREAEWNQVIQELIAPVFLTALFWPRALSSEFPDWFFFPPYLWLLLSATLTAADGILQCGWMIFWSICGKRSLLKGKPVSYKRQPFQKIVRWIFVILLEAGAVFLLIWNDMPRIAGILAGCILAVAAFSAAIFWFRPSRDINWALQSAGGLVLGFLMIIAIFWAESAENEYVQSQNALAQLPLIQTDYREMDGHPGDADFFRQKSLFGSRVQGISHWVNDKLEENVLSYDVYHSEYAWILDKIWKTETSAKLYRDTTETDPRPWKALEARTNKKGTAVCARYEDALLFFYADTPPDASQINIILDKLNLQEKDN